MLLNKINVLDKGYVASLCFSGNGKLLQDIQDEFFQTNINLKLLNIASAVLMIKCPLFIQLNLSQSGLNIISTPSNNIEAYIPDLSMIDASPENASNIHNYIKTTTEALILNQKGLPMDGCDGFTAQLLSPISIYSEIIVHGNISAWISFLKQKKLPKEVSLYKKEILNILRAEWRNIDSLL